MEEEIKFTVTITKSGKRYLGKVNFENGFEETESGDKPEDISDWLNNFVLGEMYSDFKSED